MTTELRSEIAKRMEDDLAAYELNHKIDLNYQKFYLTIANDEGKIVGVLVAYTAYAEIYIEDIWVDSNYRFAGYGSQLVAELEEKFKGKGYNNINLCTSEFQAPEFYKKCGFELEFIRKNKNNPKLNKYFFVKFLLDN